jgi:hypothetical protein
VIRDNRPKAVLGESKRRLDRIEVLFSLMGFVVFAGVLAVVVIVCCLYSAHARIRKSLGEMTRKLSDTASQ